MIEAAERYAAFLRETPDERAWLDEWVKADLTRPPKSTALGTYLGD
jgi:hypothetical protein